MIEKLIDKLVHIDKFCAERKLDYAVTGTCALKLLGVEIEGSDPHDIDIRVFNPDRSQVEQLGSLQTLTGGSRSDYVNGELSFNIMLDGVKLNVLVCQGPVNMDEYALVNITSRVVMVHKVMPALQAKMSLSRLKDYKFLLDFIQVISSYGK